MDFKNQDPNKPLTVGEFQEHIETLGKVVATKIDLHETEDRLKQYVDKKFDTVLNSVDAMAKDVKAIREEQIMKVGRDDRQDDDLRTLDTRVTGVEHRIGIEPV
ncbi:MAG: hypothetical protein U1C18_01070 [Patescibacteria group bacterium]|nr:hypothetical protein [bacterium]MDZ4221445.1 hypothetical protein [Patescibacteria group bacterium]